MRESTKKVAAILSSLVGIAMVVYSLALAFMGSKASFRGNLLVGGIVLFIIGLYLLPTVKHNTIIKVLFLMPLVVTFLVTVMVPFVFGIFYSLTDWNGVVYKNFIGLQNYITMLKAPDYIYSFVITLIFTVLNMVLVNIVSFGLAMLCTSEVRGKNIYRSAFFLPNLIGGIVLGYVWQFIFNKVFITLFGGVSMLTNANTAILAILTVSVWQYAGYIMMIYVTGLQTLPGDVLEASSIDGANFWTTLFKIKIPMIWNTFTVCIFLTLVHSFKQFDLNFALTNGAPSRIINNQMYAGTEFLALNIFNSAIAKNNYSFGQAKAVVFFILLALVSLTQVAISKKKEVEV